MALFDDKDDKTEPATPKRMSESRRKGQVAQSVELSMAMMLLAAVIMLELTGPGVLDALKLALKRGMTGGVVHSTGIDWVVREIHELIDIVGPSLLPLLAALITFAILIGYVQVGFMFSWEKLRPKLEKLNPVSGVKRLFSMRNAVRAGLAAVKLTLLGTVLYLNVSADLEVLLTLPELPFSESALVIGALILKILWWIAVPLLAIGILDLIYQRWQHKRDMRMSKQEVKDETKQTEGDPEIKARIKRAQREIARRRMMAEVPNADVVITNPTHWAVALKYERAQHAAPVVTAKGSDRIALRIREIAREAGVPIMEDPPLARGLCRGVKLGEEIPPRFYKAVAAVLSHVMRMRKEAV